MLPLIALLIPACTGFLDDARCDEGRCDLEEEDRCLDPKYGDGTCDTQLACDAPDIDCFMTFESDEQAATWFGEFETKLASEEGRAPRALLAPSDPRFVKFRELLDRGWDAFRSNRPVAKLRDARPALVVVDDPVVNAFVAPDVASGRAGFAVMVQTGLIALDGSDDANLGVMMHEFQHVAGLHIVADVKDRLRRFYVAPEGKEPIGKDTAEDPIARAAGSEWFAAAGEVGPYANAELGGLPLAGQIDMIFTRVFGQAIATDEAKCAHAQALVNAIRTDVLGSIDRLDGTLGVNMSGMRSRVDAAIAALRNECLAGVTVTFAEIVASIAGVTPDVIEGSMSAEDKALVTGKHIIDALAALTSDRRAKMRAAEAAFERDSGRPWSALRYFSTEEDADDVSVPVLRGAGLDPTGNAQFLFSAIDAETQPRCRMLLDYGDVPPYGFDLTDEHHATCWRVDHVSALAEQTARARTVAPLTTAPLPARLPIPVRLRDRIAY